MSGVDFLFIGLGCPKQEQWMYDNHEEVEATMFGVGAAFEYAANEYNEIKNTIQLVLVGSTEFL